MFKHASEGEVVESKKVVAATKEVEKSMAQSAPSVTLAKDVSPAALRDLLEKNLKWSQIIYEQNRKINRKLFWTAFAGWLRVLILVIPFVIAFYLLPPLLRQMQNQYKELLPLQSLSGSTSSTIQDFLKVLPLGPDQQAQIKSILNK